MVGKDTIFWTYALTISLSLPYLDLRMVFALLYPSVVKGSPSMVTRTLGSSNSFKYKNLVTFAMAARSIFVLNWFENLSQSVGTPLNFIMTGFGSFVWVLDSFSYFFVDSSCAYFSISV